MTIMKTTYSTTIKDKYWAKNLYGYLKTLTLAAFKCKELI